MSNPNVELENLLSLVFSSAELRRILRRQGGVVEALEAKLPDSPVAKDTLMHEAARKLAAQGLATPGFFLALGEEIPGRKTDIERVAALFVADAAPPPLAPRTALASAAPLAAQPPAKSAPKAASVPAEPAWNPVRLLHLSDLHFDEKTAWDASTVLGRLAKDVAKLRAEVGIDLVVVTGDIANKGKASEYEAAWGWLSGPLAEAAGVGVERIRVVPGNHDVDRGTITFTGRALVDGLLRDSDPQQATAVVLGSATERAPLLSRKSAWQDFARRVQPALEVPWWSETLTRRGWTVHLAGFDSALLSGSDQDARRLMLGRWQCNQLLEGADEADLAVALLHHPWDYLTEDDATVCEEEIRRRCGLILRGHLHQQKAKLASDPDRDVLELAAGSAYAGSKWANAYQLLELDPGRGQARVHFRTWDGHDWIPDRNRYQKAPNGVATLPLRRSPRLPAEPAEVQADDPEPEPIHAPDPPPPDPEARLRALIAERIGDLPAVFELPGQRHALSEVYVELALSPESLPRGENCGPDRAVQRIEDVLDHPVRRWALCGEAGSGKTTLLHHLAQTLLSGRDRLPVPLRVAELQRGDRLKDAVSRAYDAEAAALVHAACAWGRAVILLDGLDEAVSPEDARAAVQSLAVDAGTSVLIVSSRDTAYSRPGAGFGELRVLPLDDDQQVALLGRWVGEARARAELAPLSRRPRLARMARNPLLLTLMGLVLLREPGSTLPSKRADLYERAVGLLLRGLHRPERARRFEDPPLVRDVLSRLALALHGQEQTTWPLARLREVVEADARAWGRVERTWKSADHFLAEVAVVSDLLVPEGPRGDPRGYRFPHRTFREYLAGVALADDLGRNGLGEVPHEVLQRVARSEPAGALNLPPGELNRVLDDGVKRPDLWAEVLALTAGLLGEGGPDRLVRRVAAKGDRRLLLRVVADADGLQTDTVDAALALERGWRRWEARKKILEDLPGLVGDPAAVVSLIRRFVRGTTDGNDLYWARESLRAIAAGSFPGEGVEPAVRKEADAAAAGIFDHLPKEKLEKAKALLAKWWKTVPPEGERLGPYKVGSEEYDDEKPVHDVTLTGPFQMLGVPVTWEMYLLFDPNHCEAQDDFSGRLPTGEAQVQVPVYRMTWYAATMFAAWVGARLPAEAEWELACRAGTSTRYWSGDGESDLAQVGWYSKNSGDHPHPVAQKRANPWGLHDVHGNVWEWCLDGYHAEVYASRRAGLTVNPLGTAGPTYAVGGAPPGLAESAARDGDRVLRGGSWSNSSDLARSASRGGGSWSSTAGSVRSAFRDFRQPSSTYNYVGFRLVLPITPDET